MHGTLTDTLEWSRHCFVLLYGCRQHNNGCWVVSCDKYRQQLQNCLGLGQCVHCKADWSCFEDSNNLLRVWVVLCVQCTERRFIDWVSSWWGKSHCFILWYDVCASQPSWNCTFSICHIIVISAAILDSLLLLLHPFNSLFSRITWVSRYQKGKTSLDLNEARDGGGWGGSGTVASYANNLHLSPDS